MRVKKGKIMWEKEREKRWGIVVEEERTYLSVGKRPKAKKQLRERER